MGEGTSLTLLHFVNMYMSMVRADTKYVREQVGLNFV